MLYIKLFRKMCEANLLPYNENTNVYSIPKVDNLKNKMFNQALKGAEIAFKASLPLDDNKQCQQNSSLYPAVQTSCRKVNR